MNPNKRDLSRTIRIRLKSEDHPETDLDAVVAKSRPVRAADDKAFGRELFRSVYDGILLTTEKGRILDANPRAASLLRITVEALRDQPMDAVVAGAEPELIRTLIPSLKAGRYAMIEGYGLREDDTAFPAEVAVSLLRKDPFVLSFFVRDVTRRRETEDLLRTGYNALKHASNGIAVLDRAGALTYLNKAFTRLWQSKSERALRGRMFSDLVLDDPPAREMMIRTLVHHGEWQGELTGLRTDGTRFPALVAAAGNRDTDGTWTGAVISVTDITSAKQAEEAMREAERRRAMLASLGAACHHLAQPATVILGNLGVIEQLSDQTPEELRRLIASCTEAAEELARVLHRLNSIDQYQTVSYLSGEVESDRADNQLLDI